MRVLVVDNYDSFVFNLVQYLGQLGVAAEVWRNDDERLREHSALRGEPIAVVVVAPDLGSHAQLTPRYWTRLNTKLS